MQRSHPYFMNRATVDALESRRMLSASLVKDINLNTGPAQNGDVNQEITASGGNIYFRANDMIHGPQLWTFPDLSSNAPVTPTLLKVIDPNVAGVGPTQLTDVNGTLFFTQDDGVHGVELWKTNGTSAGTILVKDLDPGSASSSPGYLTSFNGKLYFAATDGTASGLYSTDGTSAGTLLLKQLTTGMTLTGLVAAGDKLSFGISSNLSTPQTWISDGTVAGTMLSPLPYGDSLGSSIVTMNGINYDFGYIGGQGGLYQVNDAFSVVQRIFSGSVESLVKDQSTLYLMVRDNPTYDLYLYKSDGTTAGTTKVALIDSSLYGYARNFAVVNGTVLFEVGDLNLASLWRSDGTPAGTLAIASVAQPIVDYFNPLVVSGNKAYFIEQGDPNYSNELWVTDGTSVPTVVKDIRPGPQGAFYHTYAQSGHAMIGTATGKVYFSADDGTHGIELWLSDGTAANTVLTADINAMTLSSDPSNSVILNAKAIFAADDGVNGVGLWSSDGSEAGTVLIKSIAGGSTGAYPGLNPTNLTVVGNLVYFSGYSPEFGYSLWQSDGTTAGTIVSNAYNPGNVVDTRPSFLTAVGKSVYFEAVIDRSHGGLFRTDGTVAGTLELKQFGYSSAYQLPHITVVGSEVFFQHQESSGQTTLFSTDGTVAGTSQIDTFTTLFLSGVNDFARMVSFHGLLFFAGSDALHGAGLWKSDGTAAGTVMVKEFRSGYVGSAPQQFTIAGDSLYFAASTSDNYITLWKTDGTSSGTVQVDTVDPVTYGYRVSGLIAFGSEVVYAASTGVGAEPWVSDGTAIGTHPLAASFIGEEPGGFTVDGSIVYFSGSDTAHGYELWSTDGTIAGTQIAADINPGTAGSNPHNYVALSDGSLLFAAGEPMHGTELWKFSEPATVAGTITGSVINGGVGLSGSTIFLDANNNGLIDAGELSTITSASGAYSFVNVPVGVYSIRQIAPGGYTQSIPANNAGIPVTIGSGSSVSNENFSDIPIVTLTQLTGTTIGTIGSYKNKGNSIANALDGNLATYFDGPTANGDWVGLDLGSTGGVLTEIKYASRTGWASRMNGGIFQGSNSPTFASSVVNLFTIPLNANPSSTSLTTQSFTNTSAYRYYRYLAPHGSYGNVSEVQFFGTIGGQTILTKLTGNTIGSTGSYKNNGATIVNATDGDLTTFFDGPVANGNWVGLDLGTTRLISQIRYSPRGGFASRMINGMFQICETATFTSGVTTIYTISSAPVTGNLTTVTLISPVSARYVRYLSASGSYGNISEFQVFG